jgi:capsular polysaccharide biosynthesis protein
MWRLRHWDAGDTARWGIMETSERPHEFEEAPSVLQSAWRYKWLIASMALLAAVVGYAWEARQPTLYEGVSRWVLTTPGELPGTPSQFPEQPERFLKEQAAVIWSGPVLRRAAELSDRTASLATLSQYIIVEVANDSDVITIHVMDSTPSGAASLANHVGTAYNEVTTEQARQETEQAVKELELASRQLERRLDELDAQLVEAPNDRSIQAKQKAVQEQLDANARHSQSLLSQSGTGISRLRPLGRAPVPGSPVKPQPRRVAAVGLLFGLVGSGALAWWLNSRRPAEQPEHAGRRRRDWGMGGSGWDEELDTADGRVRLGEPVEPVARPHSVGELMDPAASAGNGAHLGGGVAPLMRRLYRIGRQPPGDVSAERSGDDLRDMFIRLKEKFGAAPLDWYLHNLPQVLAEELTMRVSTDFAAILRDNAEGSFEMAGGFGLTAEEQGAVVSRDHNVLRQALAEGVAIFQDSNSRSPTAAVGLPGSQSVEALVVVPLVEGSSWLGILVVGRRSANGHNDVGFSDQEIEHIIIYAIEVASKLQALLLLCRLQKSLQSLDEISPERAR